RPEVDNRDDRRPADRRQEAPENEAGSKLERAERQTIAPGLVEGIAPQTACDLLPTAVRELIDRTVDRGQVFGRNLTPGGVAEAGPFRIERDCVIGIAAGLLHQPMPAVAVEVFGEGGLERQER